MNTNSEFEHKITLLGELHKLYAKLLSDQQDKMGTILPGEAVEPPVVNVRLELLKELLRLYQRLTSFEQEKSEFEAVLQAATEHRDLTENELFKTSRHLLRKLEVLENQKRDLETAMSVTTEHGGLIEGEMYERLSAVLQRMAGLEAETEDLRQEKQDLQVILETVTESADLFQEELYVTRLSLEHEVARRTQELAERNRMLQAEIQERKRAEAELNLAASVFEASHEGILITDSAGRIIKVNQAYTRITGYTAAESIGRNPRMLASGRHEASFFRNMWAALLAVGYWSGELWNRRKSKEIFPCWLSISAIKDKNDQVTYYIGILADSTHQKMNEERINYLAHYDALTNLPNRVLFIDRLAQTLQRAQRDGQALALLLIDLDNFKDINEAFGHENGDHALCIATRTLLETMSGQASPIARLGGDEFAIVLDDLERGEAGLEYAAGVAAVILTDMQQPFTLEGHEIVLSASIGITIYPEDTAADVSDLMKNADTALYEAKARRNSYCFFTRAANVEVRKRLTLQNCLRRALEREEMRVYYQPQVELSSGRITGVEALLRWQHPEQGWVPPCDFVPLAESTNLIIPIGEWVLETASRQQRAWVERGLPPVRMAVNLSVRQFYQKRLSAIIADIISRNDIDPHFLALEITESLAMQHAEKSVKMLRELKELGIYLAVDDFGTGYSSLSYLQQFTVDELKIDASFTARLDSLNGATLVASIINMAHNLRIQAVAEGVESPRQVSILRQQGCDFIQGFLISRASPAERIEDLLTQKYFGDIEPSCPAPV